MHAGERRDSEGAAAGPEVTVHEHLTARLVADDGRPGIAPALTDRVFLGGEDIAVWLEGDSHWIRRPDAAPHPNRDIHPGAPSRLPSSRD